MSEYVWYRNGKEYLRSKDLAGELITKKIISDDEWVIYHYYDRSNSLYEEEYFKNGKLHRDGDKPAIIAYEGGGVRMEGYYKDDKRHRDGDKPAIIAYNEEGDVIRENYYKDDKEYTPEGMS